MNRLDKINNLAFDLLHSDVDLKENFEKVSKIFDLSIESQLNENQQIVLDWLKEEGDPNITVMLWQLTDDALESQSMSVDIGEHVTAWKSLTDKQQFEVLSAYAEWGMKEVAE